MCVLIRLFLYISTDVFLVVRYLYGTREENVSDNFRGQYFLFVRYFTKYYANNSIYNRAIQTYRTIMFLDDESYDEISLVCPGTRPMFTSVDVHDRACVDVYEH